MARFRIPGQGRLVLDRVDRYWFMVTAEVRPFIPEADKLISKNSGHLLIRARNLSVVYNRRLSFLNSDPFAALTDVSVDVFSGESLVIIGRNGVGKTTLLRVLSEIISVDNGSLENYGATTAMLSMQAGFDPLVSGRTNILLSALLLGYTKQEIDERMSDIVAFSELGEFIDQPLAGYSAGMRARLGFSVCYYMQPDILMIDEALGVGDLEFQKKSARAMEEKIQSEQTVVLVSHSANTIKNLCTRALWIEDGISKMEGKVETVIEAYEDFIMSRSRQQETS